MRQVSLLAVCALGAACAPTDEPSVVAIDPVAAYVGAATCGECHDAEFALWQASHHALSMQPATPDAVLGDFSETGFEHFGVTSTFSRRGDKFYVATDNRDGNPGEFPVAYTFGFEPLQQYLVPFPDGRLQTLPLAWDSRDESIGGQRWFHIYPDEPLPPGDELHWTGREQNWNFMCAECHSTDVARNYDVDTDSFNTTWSEINVSCEACHGPGSRHVAEAESATFSARRGLTTDLDDSGRAVWNMNFDSGIASRSEPRFRPPIQPEACGRCHSRRAVLASNYVFDQPLMATHSPSLLDDGLYFPDGQIRDEVYVYGSFLQSRMYQAGVSCGDCHEPHSGNLHTGPELNDICSTCHLPARFADPGHHHHATELVGCVDCHMPEKTYMQVDQRRDHSFRIPRPGLTATTGSPNACNQCHRDESVDWAVAAIRDWYGDGLPGHFGTAIHAARTGKQGANDLLLETIMDNSVPGIARGTALAEIRAPTSREVSETVRMSLANADPFVRTGALRALAVLPVEQRVARAAPLLNDNLRAVRIEAAKIISPLREQLDERRVPAFQAALGEYSGAMWANADRAESHVALGNIQIDSGNAKAAIPEFKTALRLDPRSVSARVNFAELYRRLGRENDAENVLREGIELAPERAALHHSLGLLLVRENRKEDGVESLRQAYELRVENARYLYVYAIALNSSGDAVAATELLREGRQRFPAEFDIQFALVTILRDQGEIMDARDVAQDLAERYPGISVVQELRDSLADSVPRL